MCVRLSVSLPVHRYRFLCFCVALTRTLTQVSYICSRYYRAPELIFGSRDYT